MAKPLTSLETEQTQQSLWRARVDDSVARELLNNEFSPVLQSRLKWHARLRRLLERCYDSVPYYRRQWQALGIYKRHLREPGILQQLPVLNKADVEQHRADLCSRDRNQGQAFGGQTQTSGTTGEPTIVDHSAFSLGMFAWLKQRELRWFRWQPDASLLSIRPSVELPRNANNAINQDGELQVLQSWPGLGQLYVTGKAFGYNNTNRLEDQLQQLQELRPAYLLMQAACLEQLSMQPLSADAASALRGALSISQTLTPNMREQIESTLQIPVEQNYGLNEIGLVASRCPEVGRYHVHSEHCLVEIVDAQGLPCEPGQSGRLLVTALNNRLMPLLRYDADDMAEAVSGPCPCGRTLPSFGRIVGRYRRTAFLPAGTWQRWGALQLQLYHYARSHRGAIRKYQAIQDAKGDFTLRIDCDQSAQAELEPMLREAFAAAVDDATVALTLERTRAFDTRQRKFQNFVSAFTPEMDN